MQRVFCLATKRDNDQDITDANALENIDQTLFDDIIKERKARRNWRKLLTMIGIVNALSQR